MPRTLILVVVAVAVSAALILAATYLHQGAAPPSEVGSLTTPTSAVVRRALIADALHDMFPNNTLLHLLTTTLSRAGYVVDVRLGSSVTPDLFRNLTRYSLVILRLHGGYGVRRSGERVGGLFTGVVWSYRFYRLALEGYVAKGVPFYAQERAYVALLPKFLRERVRGSFPPNSTVVAFGCYTALDPKVAEALFSHGLRYYIGWRGRVSVEHMDRVLSLLVELLAAGTDPAEAVEEVNKVFGPDPLTGEALVLYTSPR